MGEEIFYMVFIDGGNTPTKKYYNFGEAHEELERLVRKQGKTGWVMQSVGIAYLKDVEFRTFSNYKPK